MLTPCNAIICVVKEEQSAMGDAYFVDMNYEAAVEAYTKQLAIKEDATTYQRRAAAYLALKKDLKV